MASGNGRKRTADDEAFAKAKKAKDESRRQKEREKRQRHEDEAEREKRKKKPLFAGLWDAMNPKRADSYTFEQDMRHSALMFCLIMLLVCIVGWTGWAAWGHYSMMHEAKLLVPAASFTSDQADSVKKDLTDQGFTDVSYVEGTGVYAYGSSSMVTQYKDSFKEKVFQKALDGVKSSYIEYGILKLELSEDDTSLKVTTLTDSKESGVISYMIQNNGVQTIIDSAAQWCAMNGDGKKLHVSFVTVDDDGNEHEYLSDDVESASRLVSNLEKAESDAANNTNTNGNEGMAANADKVTENGSANE